MAFLSDAVAVPSLVLGTLLEAGELPDFGALQLAAAPSPANSAALARSGACCMRPPASYWTMHVLSEGYLCEPACSAGSCACTAIAAPHIPP